MMLFSYADHGDRSFTSIETAGSSRCSSSLWGLDAGIFAPCCCCCLETDERPAWLCLTFVLLSFRVTGGASLGTEAWFFSTDLFAVCAVVGRSSSIRSLCPRIQLLIILKRGKVEMDERRLGAYMRGVVGACEFVQLQRSCRCCCEWGVTGGVMSSSVGGSSWIEMARPDFVVSPEDCIVMRLRVLCDVLAIRGLSNALSSGGGGVLSMRKERPSLVGVLGAEGGCAVFHVFFTYGFWQ